MEVNALHPSSRVSSHSSVPRPAGTEAMDGVVKLARQVGQMATHLTL